MRAVYTPLILTIFPAHPFFIFSTKFENLSFLSFASINLRCNWPIPHPSPLSSITYWWIIDATRMLMPKRDSLMHAVFIDFTVEKERMPRKSVWTGKSFCWKFLIFIASFQKYLSRKAIFCYESNFYAT